MSKVHYGIAALLLVLPGAIAQAEVVGYWQFNEATSGLIPASGGWSPIPAETGTLEMGRGR